MARNQYFYSYTKKQLRYLVIDPNIDLQAINDSKRLAVQPMSPREFGKNIKKLIKEKKVNMTLEQYKHNDYMRGHLPACRCREILLAMVAD